MIKYVTEKYGIKRLLFLIICFFSPLFLFSQKIISIQINGSINPASAEYIHNAIEKAGAEKAECLLIHLNTPGGLLTSTRNIVGNMLKSPVPLVVYVFPEGAHAGSAGVFITLAANVAAMAPGTNIGAAHPVSLQGMPDTVMSRKMENDAAAFIRSIALKRNRNIEWSQEAVRGSVALSEKEAIEANVVDYIADNDHDLLTQIDGKNIEINGGTKILQTKNASIENYEMGFFQKILDWISDPNISYMLMMIGFFGIIFELFNPGLIFPGIAGVISLVFALYSMSSMPVNYAGLSLIIFGIILFLLEIKIISHGLLAIGGTVSVLLGSLFLFRNTPGENFASLSYSVIFSATAVTTLFFLFVVSMGIKAQRTKPAIGKESFIGKTGEVISTLEPKGIIKMDGEIWNAVSLSEKINVGERVAVKEIKDLTLYVEKYG
jgi:membrane-bound serine protease (ClpP class)